MYVLIALLLLSVVINVTILVIHYSFKKRTKDIINNRETLEAWLEVHNSLRAAQGAVVVIKTIDPGAVFFREPPR